MEIEASNASTIVKRVRTAMGMTQEELAHAVGATISTVNRWERERVGMSSLSYLTIISYVKMCKIDLRSLEIQNCFPEPPPFVALPYIAIPSTARTGFMLRKFRADAGGITQEQLAHQMGISFSAVSRWENAHIKMSRIAFNFLRRLAIARNIELDMGTP